MSLMLLGLYTITEGFAIYMFQWAFNLGKLMGLFPWTAHQEQPSEIMKDIRTIPPFEPNPVLHIVIGISNYYTIVFNCLEWGFGILLLFSKKFFVK